MLAVCVPALVTRLRGSVSALDLSKIEAGKLELNPEPVNLARHISEWRLWILRLTAREKALFFVMVITGRMQCSRYFQIHRTINSGVGRWAGTRSWNCSAVLLTF